MNNETQQMMQAVHIKSFGAADQLQLEETMRPAPGKDEVLIRVHAAGVNRPDILQRLGKYPPPAGVTDVPGLEVAGEVIESQSPQWQKGDKICALIAGGGYAEYAVAPAGQCLPVPKGLTMVQAAALPETVFTVWNNVFVRGQLRAGETLLVHGGSSGIGTTAIQMARAAKAKVVTTAGSVEKCEACLDLGANLAVNYKIQDFVEETEKKLGKNAINVVLDMVGSDYVPRNMSLMAEDGRHVSIAFLNGSKTEVDITQIMRKRLILTGSTLRARPIGEKSLLAAQIREVVWPWIEDGLVRPVIYKKFDLADAAQAHDELEKGNHIGKIVLNVL